MKKSKKTRRAPKRRYLERLSLKELEKCRAGFEKASERLELLILGKKEV
jgi:hypothetical protein